MLTDDKREKLKALLLGLGEAELRSVVHTVEAGRRVPGIDLPSDEILNILRPSLAGLRPSHLPTASRVLCEPCEDLFVAEPQGERRLGRISRALIAPYTAATAEMLGTAGEGAERRMIDAFRSEDWEGLAGLKADFRKLSVDAWSKRIAAGVDDAFRARFGGPDGIEALREAILCLRAAESIAKIRRVLPIRPAPAPDAGDWDILITMLEMTNTASPSTTGVAVWTIFRRLRDPMAIEPLLERMDRSTVHWSPSAVAAREAVAAELSEASADAD